ncbi:MAG: DnaD domain protein [Clostridia bacterium]|nr:DnaD domain protein [Clostridia bacterium]
MTCSYAKEFSKSAYTDVENAFINEYLPESSGDAVRVYLYGLFLCQHPEQDKSIEEIASTLNMKVDEVKGCFTYWEEFGLLSIVALEPFTVQYLPVRTSMLYKPRKFKAEKYTEFTKSIQALLPSRMISTGEYTEYFNVMESYSIKPEAMVMIVKYCTDRKGTDVGYRYIVTVAKDFGNRGITTVDKVEKELSSYVLRSGVIARILKGLSLKRQPEIEDSTLLKKWTQDLNFEEENIVFAAEQLKKGSMAKLDAFLLELYSTKSFSKEEISSYVKNKKNIFDLTVKISKALSIYVEVVDTVIDTYVNKWVSYGFTDQTLLLVASHCFRLGSNTFEDMDALLTSLRNRGFIDLSSVSDLFENEKKQDEFIQKVLSTAGINRRPNPWDRENLTMWKSWNFSEDMILEAAKLSAGKSSPIAYVNGILSNWKNKNVFNPTDIASAVTVSADSQESYNREYEKRRMKAVSVAQKNTETAMAISGFSDVYARIDGIEKDLAFAEIGGDSNALERLEQEKKDLFATAEKLLATKKLTFRDLSPRYKCEKCNDTGYVGTRRCDCFNKN